MKRQLRVVSNNQLVGELEVDANGTPYFRKYADKILIGRRRRRGDEAVAQEIMEGGWSNGYIYFTDPKE